MTTDQKPTGEQVGRLANKLEEIGTIITIMMMYHNKRTDFFNTWNLRLKIIDIFLGVGTLLFIGLQAVIQSNNVYSVMNTSGIAFSLLAAGFAVILLFFGMLLDLTRKEEKHRWLASIYRDYNKELSEVGLITWGNLTKEEYKKCKALQDRLTEGMNNLKKEEYPILEFDFFLCGIRHKITEETEELMFLKVKWWQFWLANYFSMINILTRFIAKHNQQERQQQAQQQQAQQQQAQQQQAQQQQAQQQQAQQQQQQQQPNKENKDKQK